MNIIISKARRPSFLFGERAWAGPHCAWPCSGELQRPLRRDGVGAMPTRVGDSGRGGPVGVLLLAVLEVDADLVLVASQVLDKLLGRVACGEGQEEGG